MAGGDTGCEGGEGVDRESVLSSRSGWGADADALGG